MKRKRLNRPGCGLTGQPALAWNSDKVDFAPEGKRGTRAAVTQRARVTCLVIEKLSDARPCNQARVTEQDVRKHLICDLPVSLLPSLPCRKRKESKKSAEFYQTKIFNKCAWRHPSGHRQAASFRPVTPPFPAQQRSFRSLRRSFHQKWSTFCLIFTWL